MTAASAVMVGALTSGSRARWLAWTSVVLYAASTVVTFFLEFNFVGRIGALGVGVGAGGAAWGGGGPLIVSSHPLHPIGWMFCPAPLFFGASFITRQYAIQALVVAPGTLPFGQAMAWFGFWLEIPAVALFVLFLPLLF